MKILIINSIYEKNSIFKDEFVKPIEEILKHSNYFFKTIYFSEIDEKIITEFDKIIICGTALKDFKYLDNLNKFKWIKNCEIPILGICAGAQIIGEIFNLELFKCCEIGMFEVEILGKNKLFDEFENNFKVYCLHNRAIKINENFKILAKSKKCAQVIKHKNKEIYGVLFHPEVKCSQIILNFIKNIF